VSAPLRIVARLDTAADLPAGAVQRDRFDRVQQRLRSVRRQADGALLAEGTVAREGIYPYPYRDSAGAVQVRRVLVTREALTDRRWLDTLARSAVTVDHPLNADGTARWVTPENVRELGVGDVDGTVTVEEDERGFVRVVVRSAVREKRGLDAIGDGQVELSPGYQAAEVDEAGEHPTFGHFDAKQISRWDNNHLAIVDMGRGSATASDDADRTRLHLDGAMGVPINLLQTEDTMNKALLTALLLTAGLPAALVTSRVDRLDTPEKVATFLRDNQVDAARLDAIQAGLKALKRRDMEADPAAAELEKLKGQVAALTAENATLKGEADAVKAAADAKKDGLFFATLDAFRLAAIERVGLESAAEGAKVQGAAKMDGTAIKLAVLKARGVQMPDGATSARVDGAWDVLAAGVRAGGAYDALRLPAGWTPPGSAPGSTGRIDYSADSLGAKQLTNLRGETAATTKGA
jgi:hypothetical protein